MASYILGEMAMEEGGSEIDEFENGGDVYMEAESGCCCRKCKEKKRRKQMQLQQNGEGEGEGEGEGSYTNDHYPENTIPIVISPNQFQPIQPILLPIDPSLSLPLSLPSNINTTINTNSAVIPPPPSTTTSLTSLTSTPTLLPNSTMIVNPQSQQFTSAPQEEIEIPVIVISPELQNQQNPVILSPNDLSTLENVQLVEAIADDQSGKKVYVAIPVK